MTETFRAMGKDERDELTECLARIIRARARLRDAQKVPGGRGVYRLRLDLITALEEYDAALGGSGAPLPRQLRAELDLQRGIGHRS